MAASWEHISVDDVPMKTYLAVPGGEGPFPGVVVAQHASGVDVFIQTVCDRLAQAGYAAAAPDLYHRQTGMTFEELGRMGRDDPKRWPTMMEKARGTSDDEIERDVSAAVEYLRGLSQVGGSSIGITGFCGGGRVAYMMAARNQTLAAAAVFHGGGILAARGDSPPAFDLTEQIACPVAGFFADDDENPSKEDVAKISAELDRLGKAHQFHSYPETGHAFLDFSNAKAYREGSAADAWDKLVAFFGETLKAAVGAAR